MKPYELSVFKVLPVSFYIFSQYPTNIFYKCSCTPYLPSLSSNLLYFILSHSSVARSLKLLYSFIISLLFSRISCKKQNALKTLPPCYEHCYDQDNIVLIFEAFYIMLKPTNLLTYSRNIGLSKSVHDLELLSVFLHVLLNGL